MTSAILLHAAIAGLAVATGFGFLAVRRRSAAPLQAARILAGVAALLLLASLVRRGITIDKPPLVSRFDTHLVVALMLVVAAGLMVRTIRAVGALELGFDPARVISIGLAPAWTARATTRSARRACQTHAR